MRRDSEVVELVRAGAVEAIDALRAAHPNDPLVGFALCTDDDVITLYHVGCTRSFAGSHHDVPDVGFAPTEWTQDAGVKPVAFDAVCQHLDARPMPPGSKFWGPELEQDFEAMVAGLARARADASLDQEVFVWVTSTDPGPAMVELAEKALPRLNSPAVVRRRRESILAGMQHHLATVCARPEPRSYAEEDSIRSLTIRIAELEEELGK